MGKKRLRKKKLQVVDHQQEPVNPALVRNEDTLTNNVASQEERQPTPLNILFPVIKACRLCENKEGPFLNIFGVTEKVLAKKIENLLPFVIKEDDELPHKICYRCSAKVEELHDFVQKCIKSQENLEKELGKRDTYITKPNSIKKLWEEKLIKTDKTNDDICDAVIQKAIERIRDINPKYVENKPKDVKVDDTKKAKNDAKKSIPVENPIKNVDTLNKADALIKKERKLPKNNTETTPSKLNEKEKELNEEGGGKDDRVPFIRKTRSGRLEATITNHEDQISTPVNEAKKNHENKVVPVSHEPRSKKRKCENKKKDNSVAITTDEIEKSKKSTFNIMDYISTIKVNGVGTLFQCKLCNRNFLNKDAVTSHGCAKYGAPKDVAKPVNPSGLEPVKVGQVLNVKYITQQLPQNSDKKTLGSEIIVKTIEKPGPASKKIIPNTGGETFKQAHFEQVNTTNTTKWVTQNNLYFGKDNSSITIKKLVKKDEPPAEINPVSINKGSNVLVVNKDNTKTDIAPARMSGPYPVGLFQTIPRNNTPPTLTTPAMKKQSYTVLQTDNPSKLLISTRPRTDVVGPKSKKKQGESSGKSQQPFTVRLEDSDRRTNSNDNFFTFINVDPLLQPSYVLPTDNIIQESQISTSSSKQAANPKDNTYQCTMCNEVFSREKKLLAHIQAHVNALDQDDRPKKRSRNV